jgi:outer membrane biosynthesis protein TonB
MEGYQKEKLLRFLKISLGLHALFFALMIVGNFIAPATQLLQPSVQIDMVALPDLVKSQKSHPVDTSLPVKDAPPPSPKPEAQEPQDDDAMQAPDMDKEKELALKKAKEAEKEAKKALEKMRDRLKKEQAEKEKQRQEILDQRQEDLKRFEQTYRAAIKGNQLNQGTSDTGDLQAAVNAYAGHIRERLRSNWALPVWLQSQGLRAVVRMYIDGRGNIVRYQFTKFSGNDVFDDYVKGALQRSSPFAPPPEEMARGLRNSGMEVQFPL